MASFDVVYTSRGVLGWLPDIRGWAEVVAHFVAPGGRFYISEIHPVAQVFENEGVGPGELRLAYPYWEHRDPLVSRCTARTPTRPPTSANSASTAGTTAWARSSPRSSRPGCAWSGCVSRRSSTGAPTSSSRPSRAAAAIGSRPGRPGELPLMFSLLATKPA